MSIAEYVRLDYMARVGGLVPPNQTYLEEWRLY
jgi:hypothetical protein